MIGPLKKSFPIRQEILNVSQIRITCPLNQPHQFAFRPDCNNTAEVPSLTLRTAFSNPICFRSVWCRRTMIPGKVFTGFAKFRGIVSVNDFWFPIWLRELLQASLGFLWSFVFARICLDPLSGQVLHHDCISMIVSRFAIVTEDLVICCNQITHKFSARGTAPPMRLLHGALVNFGPLADLAISVFKKVSINTV